MNKLFHIIFMLSFGLSFSQINIEEIKKSVTENPQEYNTYLETFKKDPESLTQQQMNLLYYGSRFMESGYKISDYNNDYNEIWKVAEKKPSKSKAQKILAKAEAAYAKDPLNKSILSNMAHIYSSLDDKTKNELAVTQYHSIINTINRSGDGNSEDSPICVIGAGDVLAQIGNLRGYGNISDFKQNIKSLPDGSMLTVYSLGAKKIVVKLIGGFR